MTDYSQLVHYIKRREKGGFGWKSSYEVEIAGGKDYAYLAGHYDRLLDLALDWIPPALVEEIKEHETVDDDRGDLVDQFRAQSPEHDRLYREERARVDAAEALAALDEMLVTQDEEQRAEAYHEVRCYLEQCWANASSNVPETWRPIESAPRDGQAVLIWCPNEYEGNGGPHVAAYMDWPDHPGWYSHVSAQHSPSHWMWPPERPSALATQAEKGGDEHG